jgi:transposase-like protein
MSFKLNVVQEVELGQLTVTQAKNKYGIHGRSTVLTWLRKYGNFDWENQSPSEMSKSPSQKILELEAKVKLLEKQKNRLEDQLKYSDDKAVIFDMMINIAEKEYNIPIRKNSLPGQSTPLEKKKKKA